MLQFRAFEKQLAKEGCRPAYLLIGEEEYLKDLAVEEIAKKFLGQIHGPDSVRTLYGNEIDGPAIVDQCLNLGLFQQKQVIVVKQAEGLSAKSRKAIGAYLSHPSPDTCLVFRSFKLEDRSPLVQEMDKTAVVVNCVSPDEEELLNWIFAFAQKHGFSIDREAGEELISLSGQSLGVLQGEIEKLAQYLEPSGVRRIDRRTVCELAGISAQVSPSHLGQAMAERDRAGSLNALQQLLDSGEDPVRLLGFIYQQWEHLWKVKLARGSRKPQGTIDRRTYWGMNNPETVELSGKRSDRRYLEDLEKIFWAEQRMKSGQGDDQALLLEVVHQLTSK